ncbi:MAG: F0F1 ATP synthase subunit gamma [Acidimicrobiales bacterium]|nr:F0F1 ATP synthase subunit gamma [Acidimicrobiales bacterium]MYB80825.1 F0F1 ATP synthase subunit gamma [Acidimicrobiales bacterium]MYI11081.1 F0F1 ATP synthase subunit gamma [Acidimicrobiales bacterium]
MASGQERILRRRIRSIDATKKITRAMELIAASRIVRAQARVRAARPYSDKVTAVIANLASAGGEADHPLLREPAEVSKVAYVVIAADRGLCGGYNNNVLRATERAIAADAAEGRDYELVLSGRKALGYFRFRNFRIAAGFEGFSDQPSYANAQQVAVAATELFENGCQRVMLAYTQFHSMGNQSVAIVPFMPLDAGEFDDADDTAGSAGGPEGGYEFEPEPAVILERLLPRYAEARLYSALLEASASEHAARQRAMKAATDNAEELKTNLTRVMNRARQDAITTEIMEIVGGAEALAQTAGGEVDLLSDTIEARTADLFRGR